MNQVWLRWRLGLAPILALGFAACAAEDVSRSSGGDGGQWGSGGGPDASVAVGADAGTVGNGGREAGPSVPEASVIIISDAGPAGADGAMVSCAAQKVEADLTTVVQPADIIIAIDSSGSMDEEIEFTRTQLNTFSQQIVASGIDVHVILIGEAQAICIGAPLGSGSCPADSNPPRYLHVDSEVGSHDALNVILNTYAQWSPQLRAGASKSFVVITDDEATSNPNNSAATFTTNLKALAPAMFASWTFNGIFVLNECDEGERVGQVYADLVMQTKGVSGDLCLQDFKPVFDRLSQQIITSSGTELACEWDVPDPPAGEKLDFESVNVRYVDKAGATATLGKVPSQAECPNFKNGWYYDKAQDPTTIFVCPQTCTEMRKIGVSRVDVLLGCKSEPPPVLN